MKVFREFFCIHVFVDLPAISSISYQEQSPYHVKLCKIKVANFYLALSFNNSRNSK